MKKEPIWILEKTVISIHEAQLAEHGGPSGIRDKGLLQSALNHPLNLFFYGKSDLCELAAVYAERIIKNHPFVDGNKRTAYVVMSLFLKLNDLELKIAEDKKVSQFVKLAANTIEMKDFVIWLRKHTEKISLVPNEFIH